MKNRKALIDAACVLYQRIHHNTMPATADEEMNDRLEASLVEQFEKAKLALADYRASRAVRFALDSMIPGWVYVDASCHLPREKWGMFISNKPGEWEEWLVENGVERGLAKQLVRRGFGID